jgi:hypothetical protein
MGQRWHHVRTPDGFEIRDENAALVATVHNPQHDREADARLIADAPRMRERLRRIGDMDAPTLRAELLAEMVQWLHVTWISSSRAKRYRRRANHLARLLKRDAGSVMAELQAEAFVIAKREAGEI